MGNSWLLSGNICSVASKLPVAQGMAGQVLLCLRTMVESSPAHGVMCTLHAAKAQQPCVTLCVYSSSVVTDCKCLCLKDLWERVERVRAVRAVPSSCGSAMSRESWRRMQGCWTTSGTCSPCGVPMPDGYSCIKWIGLIYEPLLLTERWKACIWICDFLCDLSTSYFISQSWSLDM